MSDDNAAPLDGKSRAAILLMSLGETAAAEVLKYIDSKEVQQVGRAMTEIGNVSQDQVTAVAETFAQDIQDQTALGVGSEHYLRNILGKALGPKAAEDSLERILQGRNAKGLESLKYKEPEAVAELVRDEQPQVIAVVMAHLRNDRAAAVLKLLPEEMHGDILIRVASLEGVRRSALTELDEIMEQRISQNSVDQPAELGGKRTAADILNKLGGGMEQEVLVKVREINDELGLEIQELMFIFESLLEIDDRGMQGLLREVSSDVLGVALKGADENVQEHIYKNMSKRASEILKEDMEARGPVRLSDVEQAQKEILDVALKMAEEGTLQLGSSGEEYV